jgi:predicted RNA-binding Zn ribbon-like protein
MNFAHYSVNIPYDALAENLVNTYDVSLPEPEHLHDIEELCRFMEYHGLKPGKTLTSRDLQRVHALRATTREVFESRDAGQAMRRTNALLRDKQYAAALSARNAVAMLGWKIAPHYSAIARLEAAVALNLAASLHAVGFHRYRVCQASPCRDVFVDLSKNGSRIFCGPRCATRVHVARFRGREP